MARAKKRRQTRRRLTLTDDELVGAIKLHQRALRLVRREIRRAAATFSPAFIAESIVRRAAPVDLTHAQLEAVARGVLEQMRDPREALPPGHSRSRAKKAKP